MQMVFERDGVVLVRHALCRETVEKVREHVRECSTSVPGECTSLSGKPEIVNMAEVQAILHGDEVRTIVETACSALEVKALDNVWARVIRREQFTEMHSVDSVVI
mgnify:CR=1 FL=1